MNDQPGSSPAEEKKLLGFPGRGILSGLLILLAVCVVYFPALHGDYVWDDDVYVRENSLLTAPDGLKRIWFSKDSPSQYFPLTYTSFRIERSLWGLDTTGYHLVNILLHAANALLVWRLLKRLGVPGAWLAGALFALHPVQVESVAWITERKNVLSLFFFLLALRAWVEFLEDRPGRWRWYVGGLCCFALALFAKTTTVVLPAALILVMWLKHQPIGWRRLVQVVPFVLMALAMGLVTVWWERTQQGTQGEVFGFGPGRRVLVAAKAAWFYVGKLVWPANLMFSYPRWPVDAADMVAYAWVAAWGLAAAVILYVRRFVGRGLEVAVVFFLASLSPMLGFIMLATFKWSFVADHYQYIASIGLLALAAATITKALERCGKRAALLQGVVAAVLLVVLGVLTWKQAGIYKSNETLWRDTLAKNPTSTQALIQLGGVLLAQGKEGEALPYFRRVMEINANDDSAYTDAGVALMRMGKFDEAEGEFRRAIQLQPYSTLHHNNYLGLLLRRGKFVEAQRELEAMESYGLMNHPASRNNQVQLLISLNRLDEAEGALATLLQDYPDLIETRLNRALLLSKRGRTAEAIAEYESILTAYPTSNLARIKLADLLATVGKGEEAVQEYRKVLEREKSSVAYNNLAWLLASSADAKIRDGKGAVELAEAACRLTHESDPQYLGTLAAAYAAAGRFAEAVTTGERARDLATRNGQEQLAKRNAELIELYRAQKAYHEAGAHP